MNVSPSMSGVSLKRRAESIHELQSSISDKKVEREPTFGDYR